MLINFLNSLFLIIYFHNNIFIENEVDKYYIVKTKKCNKMKMKLVFFLTKCI